MLKFCNANYAKSPKKELVHRRENATAAALSCKHFSEVHITVTFLKYNFHEQKPSSKSLFRY